MKEQILDSHGMILVDDTDGRARAGSPAALRGEPGLECRTERPAGRREGALLRKCHRQNLAPAGPGYDHFTLAYFLNLGIGNDEIADRIRAIGSVLFVPDNGE